MSKKETILDKIKKLYAKAEGAKELGSQAEYETFMAKVNKLLLENELSLGDVHSHEERSKIKIECTNPEEAITYGVDETKGDYEVQLITVLSGHNFCKAMFFTYRYVVKDEHLKAKGFKTTYPRAELLGTRENIDTTKYLFNVTKFTFEKLAVEAYNAEMKKLIDEWMIEECVSSHDAFKAFINKLVKDSEVQQMNAMFRVNSAGVESAVKLKMYEEIARKIGKGTITDKDFMPNNYSDAMKDKPKTWFIKQSSLPRFGMISDRGTFTRAFLQGCVIGLNKKLLSQREEVINESGKQEQINALMVVKKNELQEAFTKHYNPDGKKKFGTMSHSDYSDKNALKLGVKAGENTALSKGINTSVPNTVKRLQ